MSASLKQDELRGWAVVIAAFMTHFITHGIVYSYGILFLSFEDIFGSNKAEIAWIASITTGSLYLAGPFASVLLRRYGSRAVSLCGTVFSAVGCVLTVFVPNVYLAYFTLGFLTGVGYGLIFIPAVVEVTLNFTKHRALACGIALSGAGAGAFVFSPLIEYLLDTYAWRGTLLICSALLLNCVPCSLIFRNKCANEVETRGFKRTPVHYENYEKIVDPFIGSKALIDESERNSDCTDITSNDSTGICIADKTSSNLIQENDESKPDDQVHLSSSGVGISTTDGDRRGLSNGSMFQIFQLKRITVFYSAQVLFFLGFYFPYISIPDFALRRGISEREAVWIISACGIATVSGRVLLGYISDRPIMNSFLMYKMALVLAGVSTSLVPALLSYAALITYAIAYGISTAVMLSQTTVVLVEIVGLNRMSDAMGFNNMFSGIGALLGPPLLGLIYDTTASYTYPFILSGLCMTTGGILLFLMTLCKTETVGITRNTAKH